MGKKVDWADWLIALAASPRVPVVAKTPITSKLPLESVSTAINPATASKPEASFLKCRTGRVISAYRFRRFPHAGRFRGFSCSFLWARALNSPCEFGNHSVINRSSENPLKF